MRSKLMRLDRGRPEIRSKLYSNRLLIEFFNPNRNRCDDSKSRSEFESNFEFILKMVKFDQKFVEFDQKSRIFDQIQPFSIKFNHFRLN